MACLSITTLGRLDVSVDRQMPVDLRYDKVRALLVWLAIEQAVPHTRDYVATLFWPEQAGSQALSNLRQALAVLRNALADQAAEPPFLLVSRATLQFNPASNHELDALAVANALPQCAVPAIEAGAACERCISQLEMAVALYQDPFLTSFELPENPQFMEWLRGWRSRLHRRVMRALDCLTVHHESHCRYEQALTYARRQILFEPAYEPAYRVLLRCAAALDNCSEAAAHYQALQQILDREFGIEPQAATRELWCSISNSSAGQAEPTQQAHLSAQGSHARQASSTALVPFIGRLVELERMTRILADPDCRLITLIGPGGIGKTRLAQELVRVCGSQFRDGACVVPLAPIGDPLLLPATIARALALELQGPQDPFEQVLAFLRDRQLLLLLDNFEHLLDSAPFLSEIMCKAPRITLLATSRERLGLAGEWLWDVSGLPITDGSSDDCSSAGDAVRLFMSIVQRQRRNFAPDRTEVAQIGRICRRLDGNPLAIQMAATWSFTLGCAEIEHTLERSLAYLSLQRPEIPARHQSMRVVLDHSWQRLSSAEQQGCRRLAVFRGGFTRQAAAAVAGVNLPMLVALIDKSLVQRSDSARYTVHELVRQYAEQQLREAGEELAVRDRHLDYFLALTAQADEHVHTAQQGRWLALLECEHDNLRAALHWSRHNPAEVDRCLLLTSGMLWLWYLHNHLQEGFAAAEQSLRFAGAAGGTLVRGRAFHCAGSLAWLTGAAQQACSYHKTAISLLRQANDYRALGYALIATALMHASYGNASEAHQLLDESALLFRSKHYVPGELFERISRGEIALHEGRLSEARRIFEAVAGRMIHNNDPVNVAYVLIHIGMIACEEGDFTTAAAYGRRGLTLAHDHDATRFEALAQQVLGRVGGEQEDWLDSITAYLQALRLYTRLGDRMGMAACIDGLLRACSGLELHGCAMQLRGRVDTLRAEIGVQRTGVEDGWLANAVYRARMRLGADACHDLSARGSSVPLPELVPFIESEMRRLLPLHCDTRTAEAERLLAGSDTVPLAARAPCQEAVWGTCRSTYWEH